MTKMLERIGEIIAEIIIVGFWVGIVLTWVLIVVALVKYIF